MRVLSWRTSSSAAIKAFAAEHRLGRKFGEQGRRFRVEFLAALLRMVGAVGVGAGERHLDFRTPGADGLEFDSRRVHLRAEPVTLSLDRLRFLFEVLKLSACLFESSFQLAQANHNALALFRQPLLLLRANSPIADRGGACGYRCPRTSPQVRHFGSGGACPFFERA